MKGAPPPHDKTQCGFIHRNRFLLLIAAGSAKTDLEAEFLFLGIQEKNRGHLGLAQPLRLPGHAQQDRRHGLFRPDGRPHLRQGNRALPLRAAARHAPDKRHPLPGLPAETGQLFLLPFPEKIFPPGAHREDSQQLVPVQKRGRHFTAAGAE